MLFRSWLHSHGECKKKHVGLDAGTQLGLVDMAGVFIIVCVGVGISFIVLLIEWLVASYATTRENDPDAPKTLWTSLKTRRRNTWHDWRHRDDVPEMPSFIGSFAMSRIAAPFLGVLSAFREKRKQTSVSPELEVVDVSSEESSKDDNDNEKDDNELEEEEIIDFQP